MADLPVFKGELGWEFTPLPRGFDLDAYPAARGEASSDETPEPLFAPEDAAWRRFAAV